MFCLRKMLQSSNLKTIYRVQQNINITNIQTNQAAFLVCMPVRNFSFLQNNENIKIKHNLNTTSFIQQQRFKSTQTNTTTSNENGVRIYYGSLAPRMKAVKVLSLTTSVVGLAAQPILMEQGMKIGGTGMAVFLCTVAGFFTFVTPLLLHFITKKYVTEIHFNPTTEEYTATTISIILKKVQVILLINFMYF